MKKKLFISVLQVTLFSKTVQALKEQGQTITTILTNASQFSMKSIFTGFLLIFTFSLSLGQVTVSGSGCHPSGFSPVDGTYNLDAPINMKNAYTHTSQWYRIEWTGSQWIFNFAGSTVLYTNSNDVGLNPPSTGWSVGLSSCSGHPAPSLSGDIGLPVELIFFTGKKLEDETIFLQWQTASETNNDGFEIERSTDSRTWEKIGFVKGAGTTQETTIYDFKDFEPSEGINYYRLKQVDFDGKFEYSNIVNITVERSIIIGSNNSTIQCFPNPVVDELNIINGEGQAGIYNNLGQLVKSFQIQNSSFKIDLRDLPKGQYILQIQDKYGNLTTKQFIK